MSAEIELAMQTRHRLVGDQEARRLRLGHVGFLQPDRMARTIRIAMTRDLGREYFDATARRRQSVIDGIVAEAAQPATVVGLLRHHQAAALPEVFEARRLQAARLERGASRLIKMLQPLP